ncbi:hypothetical protein ONZ45_g4481 [Pleurotus djamor]|nr:hypothetical protein ONZ45_g4481 [Pleurotus djamor]
MHDAPNLKIWTRLSRRTATVVLRCATANFIAPAALGFWGMLGIWLGGEQEDMCVFQSVVKHSIATDLNVNANIMVQVNSNSSKTHTHVPEHQTTRPKTFLRHQQTTPRLPISPPPPPAPSLLLPAPTSSPLAHDRVLPALPKPRRNMPATQPQLNTTHNPYLSSMLGSLRWSRRCR